MCNTSMTLILMGQMMSTGADIGLLPQRARDQTILQPLCRNPVDFLASKGLANWFLGVLGELDFWNSWGRKVAISSRNLLSPYKFALVLCKDELCNIAQKSTIAEVTCSKDLGKPLVILPAAKGCQQRGPAPPLFLRRHGRRR